MTDNEEHSSNTNQVKLLGVYAYGLSYVLIGISHFTHPSIFVPIVPNFIGFPTFWVYLSGVFEIALGLGLFFQKTRYLSSSLIIAMLLVLYTANINMWVNDIEFNGVKMTLKGHLFRASFQTLLIYIAYRIVKLSSKRKLYTE